MIGLLRGQVVELAADGSCVVDVGGVGYEVFVPLGTLGALPRAPEEITLHVHTHVREDALILFGFASPSDKQAFRALLSVNSVGPKLALAILGQMDAGALAAVIARKDRKALVAVSGVGKKTAERILLDLENKLDAAPTSSAGVLPSPTAAGDVAGEVVAALVGLGYKRAAAEAAVAHVDDQAKEGRFEDFLRAALSAAGKL